MWFLSLIVGFSNFWKKKLHGFKNCFSRVHKIFLRKKCFNKKFLPDFFGNFIGKLFNCPWIFFRPSVKMQSRPPAELLEANMKFEINLTVFDINSWHGCFFGFYVSRGTFWGKKRLNKLFFSHFFPSRNLFRFLGKFFPAGLPNMQSMWLETFSYEVFS